jgi:hypothetical protein
MLRGKLVPAPVEIQIFNGFCGGDIGWNLFVFMLNI